MQNDNERVLGVWREDAPGNPVLRFWDNGRVSGTDGCNGVGGTYEATKEGADIERIGSTLRACPGVNDWLGKVRSVAVSGDVMTVFNRDGDKIGELLRDTAATESEPD